MIRHNNSSVQITLQRYFENDTQGQYKLDTIKFADGTSYDVETVKSIIQQGTAQNDTLYGYSTDDVLHGGADNDALYGNDGNDLIFSYIGNALQTRSCKTEQSIRRAIRLKFCKQKKTEPMPLNSCKKQNINTSPHGSPYYSLAA